MNWIENDIRGLSLIFRIMAMWENVSILFLLVLVRYN